MNDPIIRGITTTLPPYKFDQSQAIAALRYWLSLTDSPAELSIEKAVQVFENADVEQRHSVIPRRFPDRSFFRGEKPTVYGAGSSPGRGSSSTSL